MHSFHAEIELIGVNPYVLVPEEILADIFKQAGKTKGFIPIKGMVNNKPYKQTLVKFRGIWRLYVNTSMLKNSPKRIGESIALTIAFDGEDRSISQHPKLAENEEAKEVFDSLSPSRKHEIIRYIASLRNESSIDRNVLKAIDYLLGKARFVGREKP